MVVTSKQALYMVILPLTIISAVVKTTDLAIAFRVKAFVEIAAGDIRRRTESLKEDKDAPRHWETPFVL